MDQPGLPVTKTGRIDALDSLRAAVMILGVFLHGAAAYMRVPLPGLLWPVADPSEGWGFDLVVWYLHGFRIPLFFLVAGFFAALLSQTRGNQKFILHRAKRIGVPLLVAVAVILPATYFIWGMGLVEQGAVTWRELMRLSFRDPVLKDDLLGLAHLWFLQYLLIFSLFYFVLLEWWPKTLRSFVPTPMLQGWWNPLPWMAATFCFLAIKPEIYLQFENRWTPDPMNLAYYAVFFIAGSRLYRERARFERLIPLRWVYLGLSGLFFGLSFGLQHEGSGGYPFSSGSLAWGFALVVSVYSWSAVWGFLGLFLSWSGKISDRIRFVSDAAYWIYLVHLPMVGLLQISIRYLANLLTLSISPVVAFAISTGLTLVLALLGYRYFVRYSVIGNWLNGPRKRTPV